MEELPSVMYTFWHQNHSVFFWKRVEKRGFKKDADVTLKGGVYSTGYYSHRDYKHFKLGIKYVEQMEETWAFK